MPKYRLLTREELESLEKEFVDYLVVNGIMADDWEKMKAEQPENAERIVELFSDVVMEGVLRKITYLEYRSAKHLFTYQCLEDRLVLMAMECEEEGADLTDSGYIEAAMKNPPASLRIFTSEKTYSENREEELFTMLNKGHLVSDGTLFKSLALAFADSE